MSSAAFDNCNGVAILNAALDLLLYNEYMYITFFQCRKIEFKKIHIVRSSVKRTPDVPKHSFVSLLSDGKCVLCKVYSSIESMPISDCPFRYLHLDMFMCICYFI